MPAKWRKPDIMQDAGRAAVFFDRDGVVNEERHYLFDPELVVLTPGIAGAIRAVRDAGLLAVVVTNQSGVARGYYTLDDVGAVHERIATLLAAEPGAPRIDRFYCCPHHATGGQGEYQLDCDCRKPKPGMLLQASQDLDIDLSRSFLIGDMRTDLEAGAAAGCRTFLVRTGHGHKVEIPPEEFAALRLEAITANAAEAVLQLLAKISQ
jgi:D-glycero-D-manno-heptose 1,7-bisphosphate phosphatase